jgi:hypothetical protein
MSAGQPTTDLSLAGFSLCAYAALRRLHLGVLAVGRLQHREETRMNFKKKIGRDGQI